MACPDKTCDGSEVVVTLQGRLGAYIFTSYVGEGDMVEFGDSEHEQTIQRNNTSSVTRRSGVNYIKEPVTLNLFPCDPEFMRFRNDYAGNPMGACFDRLTINDPCCDGPVSYREATVTSMNRSNVGVSEAQSIISFMGILVSD